MIKLKGAQHNSILEHAAQRIMKDPKKASKLSANQPAPLARTLGMPSASADKDWAAKENRINMGALISVKPVTTPSDPTSEAEAKTVDAKNSDDEFEDGEDEILASMREKRLAELKKKGTRQNEFLALGHGKYSEVGQDEFLPAVTQSKYVVCQFYHPDFERCKILDKHLGILAGKHMPTKFIKINAEKAPFFAGKLMIKMLPTLVFFKDGIAVDRMVGFDDLGGQDDFATAVLEKRIAKPGVLIEPKEEPKQAEEQNTNIRKSEHAAQWAGEDSDVEDTADD